MQVSLDEAIEIHARVLKKRHRHRAAHEAREHAERLRRVNDHHGHHVWNRVADAAERMLAEEAADPECQDEA
jgi:hypothetical protein